MTNLNQLPPATLQAIDLTDPDAVRSHISDLQQQIELLQALNRQRDMRPTQRPETGKCPNNPNTIANLGKLDTTPKTAKGERFQNYIYSRFATDDILNYSLIEITNMVNKDLNIDLTPPGVSRAMRKMGLSLKVMKEQRKREEAQNQKPGNIA